MFLVAAAGTPIRMSEALEKHVEEAAKNVAMQPAQRAVKDAAFREKMESPNAVISGTMSKRLWGGVEGRVVEGVGTGTAISEPGWRNVPAAAEPVVTPLAVAAAAAAAEASAAADALRQEVSVLMHRVSDLKNQQEAGEQLSEEEQEELDSAVDKIPVLEVSASRLDTAAAAA